MEITVKYKATKQALSTLDKGLKGIMTSCCQKEDYILMRDGLIQRFEYCIDSFWKFLKMYLEDIHKISLISSSPRSILKLSLSLTIINDEEYDILLRCVSDRNLTSHTYDEEIAEKIQSHIALYYSVMVAILDRLNADQGKL